MSPTSHLHELDLLRRQVADLARELAERDQKLYERTRHLQVAQALAHLGSWNWDIASGEVEWSDELYRIFGYEPRSREMTFDSFVSAVLPDDHDRVLASIDDALAGKATYDIEFRIVRQDGEIRMIHSCGEVVRDSSGQPLRMFGTALDVTDCKREESVLKQRETYFRALIEHSSDIITVLDQGGVIQFESPSIERLLGYAQHELNGRIAFEFVHHEDLPAVTEKFRLLIERPGTPQMAEFRFRHKDGSWRSLEGIGRATSDPEGRWSVIVNSRDITERKLAEAMLRTAQEKLRQALQASGTGLWDWNTETNEAVLSEEWKYQLGYEPTEMSDSFETWTTHLHPDDHDRAVAYVRDYLSSREGDYRQEFRLRHKDGTYRWIEARASFVTEADGRSIRLLGSHTDITDRKRMEESVRESEEWYRTLVELSPSGVFVFSEGQTVYINHTGAVLLGAKDAQEILDRPTFEFIHSDYHQEVRENVRRLLSGGMSVHSAERMYLKMDGTPIPVQVEAARITWNGKPAILGLFSDITERKRGEDRVREMNLALAQAMPGISRVDFNGRYLEVNQLYAAMLGYEPSELLGRTWEPTVHPEDLCIAQHAYKQLLENGKAEFECRAVRRDGSIFFEQVLMVRSKPSVGGFLGHHCFMRDITERKQTEEALRESEERFSKAFRTSPHLIGITELETGRCIEVNDACLKVYGFCREEVIGNTTLMLGIWPDLQERTKLIDHLRSKGSVRNREVSMRMKNGDLRQFLISVDLITLKGKRCLLTIGNDITERKRVEVALQESEERYGRATAIGKVGVWEMDIEKNQYYYGDANLKAIFGYTPEELSPEPYAWLNLVSPGDRPIAMNNWERMRDGTADMCRCELRMVKKDGSIVWIDVRCHSVRDQNGRLTRLIGAIVDITERKQAEEALRASEERFAKAFRASPHPVVVSELDSGRVVDANDAAYQLFGYCKEEVVGYTTLQVGLWRSAEERARFVERLKRVGSVRNMEVTLRSKSGEIRQCLLSSELIELNGKPCSVTVGDDVTESKRMERALRLTQFSVDQAVEAILWVDQTGRIFNVNETACRMLGYARQDLTTMTMHDIDPNFPVERWLEHWNYLKKQGALAFEATYWSRTGTVLEMEVTFNYLQYDGKEYGCAILRDIGERRRAEAELHRSHTFLRQVIDTDPDLIFAKDREGYFTMANKAVADWYGSTVEDLVGKSDADFNPNAEEVECFRKSDLEVIHSGRDRFIPEEKLTDAGGRARWLQTVKRPIFDDQGRVHMVLGTATDITERKRMEEILLQRERDLSAALQERERISQDLHDGILQSLYAVGLGLEACKPLIKKQQDHVAEKFMATLNQAIGQLNQVMTEVRNFIAGLESQVMQGGDFSAALRTMVETMSTSSSARCRVRIDDAAARRLSTEQALHIINIVREGLSNALRHSRAKQITVSLRDLIRSDRLAVTDDGIGFNTRSVQGVGHGLVNMAARAQKIRGLFAIQSKPDKGTRIRLDLPKDTHYAHN